MGWLVLLALLCTGLVHAATYSPGDPALFTADDTLNVPILEQNGNQVIDERVTTACPAGQFISAISLTGRTCEVGSATSGAFFVLTQPNASLPNAQLLGANIIMRGSHAGRPAASIAGRRYFYTDAPFGGAYDTGSAWVEDTLDWGQVTNRTTLAHATSHNPGQSDDISATYATKAYADAISQGLDVKASVVAATTAALPSSTYSNGTAGVGATITGTINGALAPQDGVTLTVNQALLVKDQASGFQNGIYTLTTVGDGSNVFQLTRRTDADSAADVSPGLFTFIEQGSTLADSGWVMITNSPITIGTTTLTFSQFSGGGTILGGAGLLKTGNTLDVGAGTCITAGADTVSITAACITDTQISGISGPKITSGTVDYARLPLPTLTTPGVIKAIDCTATSLPYVGGIDTNGDPICTSDVTGTGGSPPTVTLSNLIGASATATAFIPANSLIIGVRAQVLTAVTGATSFQVGIATDLDRYGAAIAIAQGTVSNISDFQQTEPSYYAQATDVVVTANGGDFTAGAVKLLLYYTTLDAFHISGPTSTVSTMSVIGDISDGNITSVPLTGPTDLRLYSSDDSMTFEVTTLETLPSPVIGINLHAQQQTTFQPLFDAAGHTITGLTAAAPMILAGSNPLGTRFEVYESGGDMFFQCKMNDGTPCDHIFEIAPARRFSLGTPTDEDTLMVDYAEPEVLDLQCRTTDPAAPSADRAKVYCKNDAIYARTDGGVIGPLGAGGTAAGSDTQVQFNDGGTTFGGDAGLTFNKTTNVLTATGGYAGASVPPIRPYSAIPVTAGMVYGCLIDGDELLCVTTATLLTSDAIWRLGFEMPPTLAVGCTYKLQLDMKATAATGVIRINPKWNTWAPGVTRTSLTLNAEGVAPDSVTGAAGSGDTVTLSTGDSDQLIRIKWTLNASTVTAGQRIAMDLTFEDTSTTLAVQSGYAPSLICE